MSARRRCAWAFLLLGWSAVVVIRNAWNPDWGPDLSDGGAVFTVLLGGVLLYRDKGAARVQDWRHKNEVRALKARVDAQARELDGIRTQISALNVGMVLSHAAAGRPVPDVVTANAPTLPQLRVVGD